MDRGVISERGPYMDLLQHDGAFAQFMRTHLEDAKGLADEECIIALFQNTVNKTIIVKNQRTKYHKLYQ